MQSNSFAKSHQIKLSSGNRFSFLVTLKIKAMEQTAVDEMRSRIFRKLLKNFLPFPYSSFQKAFGSDRLLYDDKNKLNKNFLKEVFSLHYNQPDLKVSYHIIILSQINQCLMLMETDTCEHCLILLKSKS